jgi:hypothetical protein
MPQAAIQNLSAEFRKKWSPALAIPHWESPCLMRNIYFDDRLYKCKNNMRRIV